MQQGPAAAASCIASRKRLSGLHQLKGMGEAEQLLRITCIRLFLTTS